MVPRTDTVAIDAEATLEDVVDPMLRDNHPRLPVYEGTLDNKEIETEQRAR